MADPPTALRVATYNVHACVGTDGRYDPHRVASVISELDADIVALQEFTYPASVALDTREPVVFTTLDRYQCALGPARQTVTHCFGNALLTRHPIVNVHRIDLSMDRREPRGALAATLDVGGEELHVLAAHLGLRIAERRFQVRQILDYLDTVRNTFYVVLGDFNDWLPGRSVVHLLDHRFTAPEHPDMHPIISLSWPRSRPTYACAPADAAVFAVHRVHSNCRICIRRASAPSRFARARRYRSVGQAP
jgi:endonuclease/exonuclease/phosphatase family metal-dependent hydrolase